MMKMTVRQIRAYLRESTRIRAREALEGSVVAGLHAMTSGSAAAVLAIWRQLAGDEAEKKIVNGQIVEMRGDWKVLHKDQISDFFKRKG